MTLEEKQQLIATNKEPVIQAFNAYLDSMYNLTDNFIDDEGKIIETYEGENLNLSKNSKMEKFIIGLTEDEKKYERIRRKIIDNDFNLSLLEINRVGLAFSFVSLRFKKQIENMTKAKDEIDKIVNQLIGTENQQIDFSLEE